MKPPTEVCIVRLSAIGDVVQTLPLAAAMKRGWPGVRITWVAQPVPGEVLRHSPVVDEILPFHRRSGMAALREYRRFRSQVQGRRWDLVVTPQVAFKAGLVTALLDAPVRLGFDRKRATDMSWAFTNRQIPESPPKHVVDEALEFARALGLDPFPVEWGMGFSEAERAAREAFFADLPRPLCGVVVGTTHPGKNWTAEGWATVVDALAEEFGFTVLLLGGPSAEERAAADEIMARTRSTPLNLLGNDLRRLIWILSHLDLVIAPDTGPLHLAVALGTPVLALFGRTNPNRSGPWGQPPHRIVDGYGVEAGPDYGMDPAYRTGMSRITPDMVLSGVRGVWPPRDPPPEPG